MDSDGSRSRSPSRDRPDSRRSRRDTSRDRSSSPRRPRRVSPAHPPTKVVSATRWLDVDSPEPEVEGASSSTRIPRDPSRPIPRLRSPSPLSDPIYRYCLSFPTSLFPIIRGPDSARTRQLVAYSNLYRLSLMQSKGEKGGYVQLIGSMESIKESWEAIKEVLKDNIGSMNSEQKSHCESLATWPVAGDEDMEDLGESKEQFAERGRLLALEREGRAATHEENDVAPRPPPPPPAEERPRWRGLQPATDPAPSSGPPGPPGSGLVARLTPAPPPSHHFKSPFTRERDQGWGCRAPAEPLPPQDIPPLAVRVGVVPTPPLAPTPPMLQQQGVRPPPPPPRRHPPPDAHWSIENRRHSGMLHDRFRERGVPAFIARCVQFHSASRGM